MSMIEDRLRAATHAAADTIPAQSAPPLHLPPSGRQTARGPSRARGRRLTGRLVAPLAAAIAGIAVIAIAASLAPGGQAPGSSPAAQVSRLLHAVPRYYLYLVPAVSTGSASNLAVVRDTRSGAIVATAPAPKSYHFQSVAAGADDRTFILEAAQFSPNGSKNAQLFRAHLDPAAHTITVTPLPVNLIPDGVLTSPKLALTANGAELAIALNLAPSGTEMLMYSFKDHSVRTWTGPDSFDGYAEGIGWGPNGALAFWYSGTAASSGVRMLNTNASSRELLKASRLTVSGNLPGGYEPGAFFALSGNGATIATVISKVNARPTQSSGAEITEFSAVTGAEVRRFSRAGNDDQVVWSNASGNVLIGVAPVHPSRTASPDDYTLGVLSGSRFVPIPHAPAYWLDIAF